MLGAALLALAFIQSGPVETVEGLYGADAATAEALLAPELRAAAARCPGWIDRVRLEGASSVAVFELNRSGSRSDVQAGFSAGGETHYRRLVLRERDGAWLIDDAVAATGQPTLRDYLATCASGG